MGDRIVAVVSIFVIMFLWMKFLGWLGNKLSPAVIFLDKRLENLGKFFLPSADIPEEALPQEGVLCPQCEEEWFKSGYFPPYESPKEDSSRTHDVACVQCHAAIPRKC